MDEIIEQVKQYFILELQSCIDNRYTPCNYAANWNHFRNRVLTTVAKMVENKKTIDDSDTADKLEMLLLELKLILEQWLVHFQKNNQDGRLDEWLELFWKNQSVSEDDNETYYMLRMYDRFVNEGLIEIYCYDDKNSKQSFIEKYESYHKQPYSEDEEVDVYVGLKNQQGNFYEGIGDFYEPADDPRQSGWWKMTENILNDIKINLY